MTAQMDIGRSSRGMSADESLLESRSAKARPETLAPGFLLEEVLLFEPQELLLHRPQAAHHGQLLPELDSRNADDHLHKRDVQHVRKHRWRVVADNRDDLRCVPDNPMDRYDDIQRGRPEGAVELLPCFRIDLPVAFVGSLLLQRSDLPGHKPRLVGRINVNMLARQPELLEHLDVPEVDGRPLLRGEFSILLVGDGMSCPCLIEAAKTLTECQCTAPGFCDRHQCTKNEHFHGLCKSRPDYFELWERGQGPCINPAKGTPSRRSGVVGLGDVVATLLHFASLGLLRKFPGCGCDRRKAWLNRFIVWGWWRA